jgi:hypothetical protein
MKHNPKLIYRPYKKKARRIKKSLVLGLFFAAAAIIAGRFLAPGAPEARAIPTPAEVPVIQKAQSEAQGVAGGRPAAPRASGNIGQADLSDLSVRSVLQDVLSDWTKALLTGDFREFHRNLSPVWKSQETPEQLASTYRPLSAYKEALERFPRRGKLVILESAPFQPGTHEPSDKAILRDNLGPESPWLVRGEWRAGRTALNFTLILVLDAADWKPVGLRVEIYERGASS